MSEIWSSQLATFVPFVLERKFLLFLMGSQVNVPVAGEGTLCLGTESALEGQAFP